MSPYPEVSEVVRSYGDIRGAAAKFIREFVGSYSGRPLAITTTGGGICMADIAKVPGSSRVLHHLSIPYASEASVDACGLPADVASYKAVCPLTAELLHRGSRAKWPLGDLNHLVCTAALVTNRYRRGEDQAYIFANDTLYRLLFPRESEDCYTKLIEGGFLEDWRLLQDFSIAQAALTLAQGADFSGTAFPGTTLEAVKETQLAKA